eukprot:4054946-Amphidinium_carterae.2
MLASARTFRTRDSKLTRLLQQSIGGNARTLIISTISAAEWHYSESRRCVELPSLSEAHHSVG